MNDRRFLFVLSDHGNASGGTAVLLDSAYTLAAAGHDTAMVHSSPAARHVYSGIAHAEQAAAGMSAAGHGDGASSGTGQAAGGASRGVPRYYTHEIRRAGLLRASWRSRLWEDLRFALADLRGGVAEPCRPGPRDVLVVPEFLLGDAQAAFPGHAKVVFVQNPFAYVRGCQQARELGRDPHANVILNIASAESCRDILEISGAAPVVDVPVRPDLERFAYCERKLRKIAYMPRKRRDEAEHLIHALKRRRRLRGYELVAIDGQPQRDVARILGESLFFVSLMRNESLGFPAMEAMASGCITVGYTGVGGREYFDESTGLVVADGDTAGLVRRLESAVEDYATDPERLDALRRSASERITARYTREAFETALLSAWDGLAPRSGPSGGRVE